MFSQIQNLEMYWTNREHILQNQIFTSLFVQYFHSDILNTFDLGMGSYCSEQSKLGFDSCYTKRFPVPYSYKTAFGQ